ncbi:MAG: hypothetical protein M0R38_12350 [Bacteroidia bacterium]|nr:hypothetical protein [Bacteroidia bacterium]
MESYIVKKLITGNVGYIIPGENRSRMWKDTGKKGVETRQRVPYEELEKVSFDADARRLFERGYLIIEDRECRIKLGFEDADPELEKQNQLILDRSQIETLLYIESYEAFKKKIEKMADGSKEILIEVAVNNDKKQLSVEKSDYIRKVFHVDVEKIQRDIRDELTTGKEG